MRHISKIKKKPISKIFRIEEIGEHYELEHGESVSIENVTPPKTQPSEGVKKSESPMEVDSKIGIDEEEKEDSSNDGNEANEGKEEEVPNGEEVGFTNISISEERIYEILFHF